MPGDIVRSVTPMVPKTPTPLLSGTKTPSGTEATTLIPRPIRFCGGVVGVFILENLSIQNTVIRKFFSAISGANTIGGLLSLIKDHIERLFDE